jgi:hypothetical protein
MGLQLAVAVADGTVVIYDWRDPKNLTSSSSKEIKVLGSDLNEYQCTCLSWNPAFDEKMTLIVGCHSISGQDKENNLQLITYNKEKSLDLDKKIAINH